MRLKVLKALLAVSLLSLLGVPKRAEAVPLGPFDVTIELCQNIQLISNVINSYANAAFPVTGQPGFVMMVVQRTNPLLDLCNFIVQLKNSDTTEAIFLTAEKLNDVTEQKWNDYLRLSKRTYSIANSFYDFNSGKKRKGTVEAESLAYELGDFYRQVVDLSTGQNPDAVRRRQEHDRQIAEFSQAARERAILKEGTDCPAGQPNAPDYEAKVTSDYAPNELIKAQTDNDIAYYKSRLIDLGGDFLDKVEDVATYQNDVTNLFVLGVYYAVKESNQDTQTVKPTGKKNADETAEKKAVPLKQTIQTFNALTDEKVFSTFKQKYESRYRSYAAEQWDKYAKVPGAEFLAKEKFKQLAMECNETKLMAGYSNLSPDEYERKKLEKFKECEKNTQVTRETALGLMSNLLSKLKTTLQKNKQAQSAMWTFESKYLGRKRSISRDKSGNSFQESVVCAKSPELIDLELIQAKQQAVNASYNETIAKESLKESMVRDEEMAKQKELAREVQIKSKVLEKKQEEQLNAEVSHKSLDLGGSTGSK